MSRGLGKALPEVVTWRGPADGRTGAGAIFLPAQVRRFPRFVLVQRKTAHMVAKRPVGHGYLAFLLQLPVNLGVLPAFLKKFLDRLHTSHKFYSIHVVGESFAFSSHDYFRPTHG